MYTCLLHFNHKYKGVWRCRDTRTAKRMGGGGRGEGEGEGEGGGGGGGGGLQFITRMMLVTNMLVVALTRPTEHLPDTQ